MDQRTLAAVFLAVIALSALLQAAFVAVLAVGLRRGDRKLAEAQSRFASDVVPQLDQLARAMSQAAELSDKGVEQARRTSAAMQETAARVEGFVSRASARVEGLAERSAERVVDGLRDGAARSRVGRTLVRAGAVARGVRQAMRVWQAYRVAPEDLSKDGDEETEIPSPD